MLKKYKEIQPLAYKILKNSIKNDRISHAYLFSSINCSYQLNFVKSFIKEIINKQDMDENKKDNIFYKIDNDIFMDLKIIDADGIWIKKEQLEELQIEFTKTAIENEKKFYIINGIEKLNKSSANSVLKFLEEPEKNIIAILISNNINQTMDTIISRCVNIQLKDEIIQKEDNILIKIAKIQFKEEQTKNEYIENFKNLEELENIIKFLDYFEKYKLETIIHLNRLWHNNFKEKEKTIFAFDIIIMFYNDVLKHILNKEILIFNDYNEFVERISNKNKLNTICKKINIIMKTKNKIYNNINNNLLMDKLISELSEVK